MFFRPDLSDRPPRLHPTPDDDRVDLGWNEGVLDDGRPYVVRSRVTASSRDLVFYFAAAGLERWEPWDFAVRLAREGVISFVKGERVGFEAPDVTAATDAQGVPMLEVWFTVEYEGNPWVVPHVSLRPYR